MRTKYIYNPKKLILLVFIGLIGLSGCKKFLDVNQNPNNPNVVDPNLLFPTAQAAVSQVVGNSLQVYGGMWAQYWTQNTSSGQYKNIDLYAPVNTDSDRPWANLYSKALINFQLIIDNKGSNLEYLKGMAYLMKAYTFQVGTDAWGDIPLSDALHADNVKPKYATQEVVYDSVFNYIDKGLALFKVTGSTNPGVQDLFFSGDLNKWKAFANTLKLKAYLRLSKVNPAKAQAGITALYATSPIFLAEDVTLKYSSVSGNDNPLYNEMVALGRTQNLAASSTAVGQFKANDDPRRFKLYDPIDPDTDPDITSIPQGSYQANTGKPVSLPSALTGANPDVRSSALAPVKLFSSSESSFLQAEAIARGWGSGDITALYAKGITQSFTATGVTDATAIAKYMTTAKDGPLALAAATTPQAKVKAIITQKYYAMCGFQGFEAWTEYRRTGYPDFLVFSIAPPNATQRPQRMIYPNSEAIYNGNFPGNVDIFVPVWWAK
jgi:hypothetical protein